MKEVWKPVVGYEGYFEISNKGRVKSLERFIDYKQGGKYPAKLFVREKIRKTQVDRGGYVKIRLDKKGSAKTLSIHRLVALSFLPNPENKPDVNHKNSRKTDNRVSNLEWCTKLENLNHAIKNGRWVPVWKGEKHVNSKITDKIAKRIKREKNRTLREMALEYGISISTVCDIRKGNTWKHIK